MGESFKLHSQSLIGYEDAVMHDQINEPVPAVIAPHATEVTAY